MTEKTFLSQIDLSRRWGVSPRTLERWRWLGEGPSFTKIGGAVRYRIEDVEEYEQGNLFNSTSENFSEMGGAA
nr:hypothetical protein 30 [bacterium]